MPDISLILNTGLQMVELPGEVVFDSNANLLRALRFYETEWNNNLFLDTVYYLPQSDKYVRRLDLQSGGYLDPRTLEMAPEENLNANLPTVDQDQVISINHFDTPVGARRQSALDLLADHWLPLPYYERDPNAASQTPNNWCRLKLSPVQEKWTKTKRVYRAVMLFDTNANAEAQGAAPEFIGEPMKQYALLGLSRHDMEGLTEREVNHLANMRLPLKAYQFCDITANPWLNRYLQGIMDSADMAHLPEGQRTKYLCYYIYLLTYLHRLELLPDVTLYNDAERPAIATNMVIDIGNSRTFGLVAEDPLDRSFSRSSILELTDLETGHTYPQPFDMRLCFRDERFGFNAGDNQFAWPSIVRLGREAQRNIYEGEQDLTADEQFDTSHSSPKRYLWDNAPYAGQWKFVSEKERRVGPTMTVAKEGLMQQFTDDGRFTPDPLQAGTTCAYSRRSLMTFCFIEILLQANMQVNSVGFRQKNGQASTRREIKRVIITCPTAMPRREQLALRECMQEAAIAVSRIRQHTYEQPYQPEQDAHTIDIIPSVRDLRLKADNYAERHAWGYDEATCCQMVYLYAELRRYGGGARDFFDMYGRRRAPGEDKTLTVASIDIGAGTTDIMVCNYAATHESIEPRPLFWDSFHLAGDDLVKRVITDCLLDFADPRYPNSTGIITHRLEQTREGIDVPNTMHGFFDDTASQSVTDKRMRKEFTVQVFIPIVGHLLDLLQREAPDEDISFAQFFPTSQPAPALLRYFEQRMGFPFEDITVRYSAACLTEVVSRTFEPFLRKMAAIFYAYKADIVLLGGRPCSLPQLERLMRRLLPVPPNRLVSMNSYRVGAWYPGSTAVGQFGDRKSMVAVGALIAYLSENGKLPMMRLSTRPLREGVLPTADYVGLLNPTTGELQALLTPEVNAVQATFSAFPITIGCRQVDIPGYPAQTLCELNFDEAYIRQRAIESLRRRMQLPPDAPDTTLPPDYIKAEADNIKHRAKQNMPLTIRFEREFRTDKEHVIIASIDDADHNQLSNHMFRLQPRSWSEEEANWLDTGRYTITLRLH